MIGMSRKVFLVWSVFIVTVAASGDSTDLLKDDYDDCFVEYQKLCVSTAGEVILNQMQFVSDLDCFERCLDSPDCTGLMISPTYWAYRECFLMSCSGTHSSGTAFKSAEKSCFAIVIPDVPIPNTEVMLKDDYDDCFVEYQKLCVSTSSEKILNQMQFVSDLDCFELCLDSPDCTGLMISPTYWAYRECFLMSCSGTHSSGTAFKSAEKSCFATSIVVPPVTITALADTVECKENKKGCKLQFYVKLQSGERVSKKNVKICKWENGKTTDCEKARNLKGRFQRSMGRSVDDDDSGEYVCVVTINDEEFTSDPVTLTVNDA